jgi:hypothetical protein
MTVFDGGPRYHIDTCYLYPNDNVVFGIQKASQFQYVALITLTVYIAVFECQNQVIFNMTVFDGGPLLSY